MSKKIYFAAPLFSQADLEYNERVAGLIRQAYPEADVFVPQEQGEINDKNAYADSKMIAQLDADAVLESDLLVALLDGITVDAGVASEIGIAYAKGIPVVGLFTDSRQQGATNAKKIEALQEIAESQFVYINLFTVGLIKLNGVIVNNPDDLVSAIKEYL